MIRLGQAREVVSNTAPADIGVYRTCVTPGQMLEAVLPGISSTFAYGHMATVRSLNIPPDEAGIPVANAVYGGHLVSPSGRDTGVMRSIPMRRRWTADRVRKHG